MAGTQNLQTDPGVSTLPIQKPENTFRVRRLPFADNIQSAQRSARETTGLLPPYGLLVFSIIMLKPAQSEARNLIASNRVFEHHDGKPSAGRRARIEPPGLKSDILRGNSPPLGRPPPASSHICMPENGHSYPFFTACSGILS